MTEDELAQKLAEARIKLQETGTSDLTRYFEVHEEVLAAERALCASRGDQFAETIDLGIKWSMGAPVPHLLSNGSRTFVVCFVETPDPLWDGTYTRVVDPTGETSWATIELWGCASVRIGEPNDEAINGHPLHGRGLRGYVAQEVKNSLWLEEHIQMNSVHPRHSDAPWRRMHHYLLGFHDEMVEAIASGIEARTASGDLSSILGRLTEELLVRPHRLDRDSAG